MPNITLSVSYEMKERMDTFSEVSWSDVCRTAIHEYLDEREKDTKITHTNGLKVIAYVEPLARRRDNQLVYMLKIKNNETFDIIIDRVLFGVQFDIKEQEIKWFDHPLYNFEMVNITSNEIKAISSIDGLDKNSKELLFEHHDKETEIACVIFGDIYYRSKTEIFKTSFHIVDKLSNNNENFVHDQMAI